MLERTRLAARRLLTVANLFENLIGIYGDREVLDLAEPLGYRLFPSAAMTCRDCLHFTNLAAEAFIRDLDLKKGERALVIVPAGGESVLVASALIKAGGIVVPVDAGLSRDGVQARVAGSGATLAVVDGRILADRPDLSECMPGVERIVASGPRMRVPRGALSLDEAMGASSGFFLPYTLKPGNVAGLFHAGMEGGSLRAVMATNEGLLGPQLWAAPLLPSRPGDLCVHAMGMESMSGFSAALLGLCMGLRVRFIKDSGPERILEAIEVEKPLVFMAASGIYAGLLEARACERDLSSVRLWFSAGEPLPRRVPEAFRGFSNSRRGVLRTPPVFVEAYDAGGNAAMLALKPASRLIAWPEGSPGLVIPPNRARTVDEDGKPQRRAAESTLEIRGPAVTPGFWNDVEGTLEAKRDGWLFTGIAATRKHLLITLL